jgi:diacylglycerol kinase (ATP)
MWLVVINPHSGNGRGFSVANRVKDLLTSRKVGYHTLAAESAAELSEDLATALSSERYQGVFAVGGDGLAHLVLQQCVPRRVPFCIVPAGTGNDFVRTLGWSLDNIEPLINRALSAPPSEIDLGNVDSEWFGAILSTGFDSVVNERANLLPWPRGPQRYNLAIAMELPRFNSIEYEIEYDGKKLITPAMLVAIGNGKSYGGGMNICPQAQLDDGLFDIVILQPVSKIEFIRTFPKVYSGSHLTHPAVKTMRAEKVTVTANAVAYADGERIGPAPISAHCIKGAGLTWRL